MRDDTFRSYSTVIKYGVIPALQFVAPFCKLYSLALFPVMAVINFILMAISKDDKAMGACKTALTTECLVEFLLICLPQLILQGMKAFNSLD